MTTVQLPYGKSHLAVDVPARNLMGVFAPQVPTAIRDDEEIISEAICNPIGTPRLAELAKPGTKCVIIADDKTRPTPVARILPHLLDELNHAGIPDKDISVVFALGTHVPMTSTERRQRMGPLHERIKSYNSEFRNSDGLVYKGTTPDGIHVVVDKRVAQADFRIAIGSILPHPECGWGGGGKIIYPGVASQETVTAFHLSYANVNWNSYGSDQAPVRLNMEEWVDTVRLDFIVNTVITPADRVYKAVAGHYIQAHRQGTEYGREIYSVQLPESPDIVLITAFRADEDFWLASKAIFAGELVIKDGGTMILVSPCINGVGPHSEYAEYVGCDNWQELAESAFEGRAKEPIAVSAGVAIAKMRKRFDISVVSSGLTNADAEKMKCSYFTSVDDALKSAIDKHGQQAKVAVLPYGVSTLPYVRS